MITKRDGMCEVCGEKPKKHVCASSLGPISFGYCEDCLLKNREPYGMLLTTLATYGVANYDMLPDHDNAYINKSFVDNILHYEDKTIYEFNMDLSKEIERVDEMYSSENTENLVVTEPVPAVSEDDEVVEFEYCDVVKMQPTTKKFSLAKGELKFIVDSLEDFIKSMESELKNEELSAYNRALFGVKINQANKIADKIKDEIDYCANCNKAKRKNDENGYSGIEASINGVK